MFSTGKKSYTTSTRGGLAPTPVWTDRPRQQRKIGDKKLETPDPSQKKEGAKRGTTKLMKMITIESETCVGDLAN